MAMYPSWLGVLNVVVRDRLSCAKFSKLIDDAHKTSHFWKIGRWTHISNGWSLVGVITDAFLVHNVSEEFSWILPNSHLFGFRVVPASWILLRAADIPIACSLLLLPKMRSSSTRHSSPSRPERMLDIPLLKCSGELEIPHGILLKKYWSNGVINVVSSQDIFVSGICQIPLLTSTLLNTLAPEIWASVSSTSVSRCIWWITC